MVSISPMQVGDIPQKAAIQLAIFKETYRDLVADDYLNALSLPQLMERTRDKLETETTFLAWMNQELIGFITCRQVSVDEGEISAIGVLASYQKQGIGSLLLETGRKHLSNCSRIFLWVLVDNNRAIAFYNNQGFALSGKQKILTMGKPLLAEEMVKTS
ncbi:GNAT family N-acetyltransferase [Streptococcus ovuberis]|uniref:GNAT family N-acetyltransferase n=1 Tax=Streptococcus ovuberis TaxID=1936207 RepID=A0A7X6N336_9STRE|nr:GNAT family N-acetyltransferase [Streptococcus ovuberis]